MHRIIFKISLPVLTLIIFLMTGSSTANETIKIANGEWPPYQSEFLNHYGFASRIVTIAFALEGITVKYSFMPWKRALIMTKSGEYDATFLWKLSDDKKPFFDASDPIVEGEDVFFHLKSFKFNWKTIDDLKKIKIGTTLGYNYGEIFYKAEKEGVIVVERAPNDEMNFRKLIAGRMPLFICNKTTGNTILRKINDKKNVDLVTYHPKAMNKSSYYLLFSRAVPKNKSMRMKFNSGLKKLKKNGKLDQFIKEGEAR